METLEDKRLVGIEGGCQYGARRLYSLWDMTLFLAGELTRVLGNLDFHRKLAVAAVEKGGPESQLSADDNKSLYGQLDTLHQLCQKLSLPASDDRRASIQRRLIGLIATKGCQHRVIAVALEDLLHSIEFEVARKTFAFIPNSKVEFF